MGQLLIPRHKSSKVSHTQVHTTTNSPRTVGSKKNIDVLSQVSLLNDMKKQQRRAQNSISSIANVKHVEPANTLVERQRTDRAKAVA